MDFSFKLSVIINLLIAIMTAFALKKLKEVLVENSEESLLASGLSCLKFFTVLANIFAGAMGLVTATALIAGYASGKEYYISPAMADLKLAAAASLAITFMTVLFFLGPTKGFGRMYAGPNLWFHLLTPLVAMVEYALVDVFKGFPRADIKSTLIAAVPALVYGGAYAIYVLTGSKEEGRYVRDWYGFTRWGIPASLVIMVVISLVTWLMAMILRWINLAMR